MAQTVASAYTTRQFLPEDETEVLALLRQTRGEFSALQRTSHHWRWEHFASPFGPSFLRVAVNEEGEIIGMRAFLRWMFRMGESFVPAVRAVDTATHPDFQRLGVFSRLTREAAQDVQSNGAGLVFNTPNARVLPGYLKLGWHQVGAIRPLVRVLNYRRTLSGLALQRLRKSSVTPYAPEEFYRREPPPLVSELALGDRMEEVVQRDEGLLRETLHTYRSAAFIEWRYASHPTIPYRMVTVERQGDLEACAIFRTNTRFGLKEVVISEVFVIRPERRLVSLLLRQLRDSVDADYLIAYFPQGSFHRRALEHDGFHQVPRQGMTLVTNPLGDRSVELANLSRWGLSLRDLEFF